MPNLVNELVVRDLTEELKDVTGMVVVSFSGLSVVESETVRDLLAEKGVPLRMVRNKLLRRVLAGRGIELDPAALKGNTAIAYGDSEAAIAAAKVFDDKDVKKIKKVQFKAGLMEGQALDAQGAAALAGLPDRDTLRSMLLGVISGPARALATVIHAVPTSVARVVQARADELEKGA